MSQIREYYRPESLRASLAHVTCPMNGAIRCQCAQKKNKVGKKEGVQMTKHKCEYGEREGIDAHCVTYFNQNMV